ncbi:MAG: sensor histidine kinase [Romboutsia sp.]|uniref:sensor histidine kinase n=1 Tax=Romboutsia sp. TaxID=1965302 RepID=UPI003F2A0C51
MNQSLFKKISKTITIASIISVIVTILFSSITIKHYFLKIKLDEIKIKVEDTVSKYDTGNSKLGERLEIALDQDVIIKGYNYSKQSIYKLYTSKNEKYKADDGKISQALEPYIQTVLEGNSIRGITKIYGLRGDSIIVGEPIKTEGEIIGAIFVIKSTGDFTNLFTEFYIVLIISMILVLISTIIPIYLSTKKLFKPLDDMTKATMAMSKGDFSVRVNESQDDEIGELAKAFNYLTLKLEQNEEEAKLLEVMRKDYVANVSHELKTPITSIRAIAETLNDDIIKDEIDKKRYYSMILRESIRLESLISDMLELSRLQCSSAALEKSFIKLDDILTEVMAQFEVIAYDLDIEFKVNHIEEIPMVFSNYNRVIQVIIILLDNAFKFTEEEGRVSIEIKCEEEFVKIMICDTGIGIEKEDLPFVFDRFYKADKSRNSIGTGIGLSIACEIIKHLDETIYVESEKGYGSKFIFTLHYK